MQGLGVTGVCLAKKVVASTTVVGSILGSIVEWSAEQIYEYSLLLAGDIPLTLRSGVCSEEDRPFLTWSHRDSFH